MNFKEYLKRRHGFETGMFKSRNQGQRQKQVFFLSENEKRVERKLMESLQGQADKFGINLIGNREPYS